MVFLLIVMVRHPYFRLYLHSNDDLEPYLQDNITKRSCLHEWPLSSVELLETSSGKSWIYKSQSAPTVEATFYQKAHSPLLAKAFALEPLVPGHQHLVLEHLPLPLLKNIRSSEAELVSLSKTLQDDIQNIKGDLPFYLDISTEAKWLSILEGLIYNLQKLLKNRAFRQIEAFDLKRLQQRGLGQDVARAFHTLGYVHGDLSSSNILRDEHEYKVLDWQRPIHGPIDLDRVSLLLSTHINPAKYLDTGIISLYYLLQIHWLSECSLHWFPEGVKTYDQQIAQLISQLK